MPTPDVTWVYGLHTILKYIGELSLLIPIYIGFQRRHLLLQSHRSVLWCCVMWAILTVVAESLFLSGRHNIVVWNLVPILETFFLSYAFYLIIHSVKTRRLLRIAAAIFFSIALIDYFYLAGLHASVLYTTALGSLSLIAIVLLYFEQLLQELRTISLEREPMFLIGVGVATYFAGTVMIFLLQQQNLSIVHIKIMMMINFILSAALNSIIARAFWLVGREEVNINQPVSNRHSVY